MPGTTTGGLPIPLDSDPVEDAALAVRDLANALDRTNGKVSTSTDASGVVNIPHGLGVTPTAAFVQSHGASQHLAFVMGADATHIAVWVRNLGSAGTPPPLLASTAVILNWEAIA